MVARKGPPPKVTPPADVMKSPAAIRFWKKHAADLCNSGRLTPVMADSFAVLCKLHADVERLEAALAEAGEIVPTARGTPMPHPLVRMVRDARRDFAKLSCEFGMTAAAESRIPRQVDVSDAPANPLAQFGIVD